MRLQRVEGSVDLRGSLDAQNLDLIGVVLKDERKSHLFITHYVERNVYDRIHVFLGVKGLAHQSIISIFVKDERINSELGRVVGKWDGKVELLLD